ncbi:MAG TPA: iron-containing alcohol dehydrogenase [Thermoplasmata archaeon]|nr:iron-containing alcohol dehydrogenase [Thermoplasmata archaeon]
MAGFFLAPRIAWGPGAIEQLSGLGIARAFLLVDPAVAAHEGPRRVAEELAKAGSVVATVADLAAPDRVPTVRALADRLRASGADGLVAVGGGRTLDAAKAARLLASEPTLDPEALPPDLDEGGGLPTRLVAIPTTSGSGSEASWSADLEAADGRPIELAHRAMVPDWALVDPAFAEPLPPERLLDGALETAAQAIEAYLSAWANPFSDALAVHAATTVVRRTGHALRWNTDDPEARAALHYAATAAGLAASNAQRGLAHALARALVAPTGLPYGRLVGIVLPFVLEYDQPGARERLEALGLAVALPDDAGRLASPPWPQRLRRLYDLWRVPTDLKAAGVPSEPVERHRAAIVAATLRSPAVLANPRVPSEPEVEALLHAVLGPAGARLAP